MFGKTAEPVSEKDRIGTIIGAGTEVEGSLNVKTSLRIDGVVSGEIHTAGRVILSENGKVKGNISASNIILSGTVEGNLKILEKTEILPSGRLYGDVETKTLVVDEHAVFDGKCTMRKEEAKPEVEKPVEERKGHSDAQAVHEDNDTMKEAAAADEKKADEHTGGNGQDNRGRNSNNRNKK